MCAITATTLYLCLMAAPALGEAVGQRPEFDHHEPVALNEAAVRRVMRGEEGTARILLERAAVIAPGDPVVAANLATLRAAASGGATGRWRVIQSGATAVVAAAPTDDLSWPDLPALWPAK